MVQMDRYERLNLAAEIFISLLSVTGNSLVLYVIYREKALRCITNYLVASLALADFTLGLVGIPCVIVNNFGWPHEFYGCLFMNCVIVILAQISIFNLMAIALERFVAVKFPIFYRARVTGKMSALAAATCWTCGLLVGLTPMFGWHLGYPDNPDTFICIFVFVIDMNYLVYFFFFGFVIGPLFIMFSTYGYIFHVVRKRSAAKPAVTVAVTSSSAQQQKQQKSMKQESRAAKRIFLVLLMFTICWMPLSLLNMCTVLWGIVNIPAVTVAVLLTHANSAMNPFIYALTNDRFKQAYKKVLHLKNRVEPSDHGTSQHDS